MSTFARIRKELSAFGLFVVAAFGGLIGFAPRPVLVRVDQRRRGPNNR
jgi:hypothetical protein